MNRDFIKGIKIGLGIILTLSLFFGIVFAVGFHSANEILGGTFFGDYKFEGNVDFTNATTTGINNILNGSFYFVNLANSADEYTKLLIHFDDVSGSSNFIDSSINKHSILASGGAVHSESYKIFYNSSLYLDGSDDHLSIPDSEDWNLGSGLFTIDFWVKRTGSLSGTETIFSQWNSGTGTSFIFLHYNGVHAANQVGFWINGGTTTLGAVTLDTNWNHVAIVKDGSTSTKFYLNGIQQGSTYTGSYTLTNSGANLMIGSQQGGTGSNFPGYIDEFRISKGIARWTGPFIPPSTPHGFKVKQLAFRDSENNEYILS